METWRRTRPHPFEVSGGAGRRHACIATVLGVLVATLALVVGSAPAQAAPVVGDTPEASWRVNGRVYATQVIGNTVVVGGAFTSAVSPTGESVARRNLAAFRLDTGELLRSWQADAGGTVRALENDGTWLYVGGAFGRLGGVSTGRLGRVRVTDASVDTGFSMNTDNPVRALDLRAGELWVGGAFTTVNGQSRPRVVKLDAATGAVDSTFRPSVNDAVWGIVKNPVTDTVYVSGPFNQAGGVNRTGVAALDSRTGAVRPTVFESSARPTFGLDVNDAGTRLFAAGGGYPNVMSAWSTTSGTRLWNHVVDGDVQAILHYRGMVYFGFHDGYRGDTQIKILAANEATGVLDPLFRPRFNGFWGVFAIAASDAGVVVGGEFTSISGVAAEGWARFRATGVTEPPPPPTSTTVPLLTASSSWRYWDGGNLTNGWQQPGHDDSTWASGAGHFGYGDGDETVVVRSRAGTTRNITTYFRTTFDLSTLPSEVILEMVADDGAVVHLNGVEVLRDNMPTGTVTATTLAARNRSGAGENAVRSFPLPVSALRVGTNTIAVEVHQDVASSSDVSFAAALTATVPGVAPVNEAPVARFTSQTTSRTVTVDGSSSSDDSGVTGYTWDLGDGTTATGPVVEHTYADAGTYTVRLTVRDAQGAQGSASAQVTAVQEVATPVATRIFGFDTDWRWYHRLQAPGAQWAQPGFSDAGWGTGSGFLGWGAPVVVTDVNPFATAAERPITSYYRKAIHVSDLSSVVGLRLETVANDGAVVYVNGVEVGRQNMRDGAVTHTTYAPTARRHAVAAASPLVVDVPASALVEGTNLIAVETHVNYRNTPDVTFGMEGVLTRR